MFVTCLDLEGVLVPEIWIAFSKASGIPELSKTTRDEPDYDKLMKWRLGILKEHSQLSIPCPVPKSSLMSFALLHRLSSYLILSRNLQVLL